ncbi:MAG: hypothetical protein R3A45_03775 [Bdellovibrionota bacterium]
MNKQVRNCDFALLYDPQKKHEVSIVKQVKTLLHHKKIICRRNYPYKGTSDGLTTSLRKRLGKGYIGIELEFNQNIVHDTHKINSILQTLTSVILS